jgi:hypothetical protein
VMSPAEDTFVGTGKTWSGFHTLMTCYSIECVLVAASSASQHVLKAKNPHYLIVVKSN